LERRWTLACVHRRGYPPSPPPPGAGHDFDGDGRVDATAMGASFPRPGSPTDLGPYFASLRERPACAGLLEVLRSGEPVAWASVGGDADWARLDDPEFAGRITAAMDARAIICPSGRSSTRATVVHSGTVNSPPTPARRSRAF
jgi:hypothetical protein